MVLNVAFSLRAFRLQVSAVDVLVTCSAFSGHQKNLVFHSSPILKSDQLGLYLFFTAKVIDWSKKLLLILFSMINSINISPSTEPMRRDTFFSF